MALWEYKIIGSGKGGFGSPSLLESHLNQLGKDEWEIISFTTHPDNPLAFHGLARRTTQRDWTLQDAAAAAAKAEAEKLRAEFAAKFQAAQTPGAVEEKPTSLVGEAASPEDGFRRVRDTDRDQDPEALADSEDGEDLPIDTEEELPSFFDFIRPHMRRNQRGPGLSLAVDYLANKIDQSPGDIVAALKECGFAIPEREDDDPVYIEYDGDLFWVNTNRHHQLFINTKEKPRPVFRSVKGQPFVAPERPDKPDRPEKSERAERGDRTERTSEKIFKPEKARPDESARSSEDTAAALPAPGDAEGSDFPEGGQPETRRPEREEKSERPAASAAPAEPLPTGDGLLARLRPMMRRNRRGPGISGSVGFLSRALKHTENDLAAALAGAGLSIPERPNDKPVPFEAGPWTYWINKDSRGGLWINAREKRERDRGADRPAQGDQASGEKALPPVIGEEGAAAEVSVVQPDPAPVSATEVPVGEEASSASPEVAPESSAPSESNAVSAIPVSEATTPESPAQEAASADSSAAAETVEPSSEGESESSVAEGSLSPVRALLKNKPRGAGASGEVSKIAAELGKSADDVFALLAQAGLALPEGEADKSESITWGDESLWLAKSEKDGAWSLHAKAAKSGRKPRAAGGVRRTSRKAPKAADDAPPEATS